MSDFSSPLIRRPLQAQGPLLHASYIPHAPKAAEWPILLAFLVNLRTDAAPQGKRLTGLPANLS
jgi:hypothetical protein